MRVIKALNNNMVLVHDDQGNNYICQGKGIGWRKRKGDCIDESLIELRYKPENEDESLHFQQLFSEIPTEFWGLAEEVIAFARDFYDIKVPQKTILPLCDHMAASNAIGRGYGFPIPCCGM